MLYAKIQASQYRKLGIYITSQKEQAWSRRRKLYCCGFNVAFPEKASSRIVSAQNIPVIVRAHYYPVGLQG